MNIHLREVFCTSKICWLDACCRNGDRFWRMPECYIHGNTIKYLRVPDEVIYYFVYIIVYMKFVCIGTSFSIKVYIF
ncbi:hypothetical protein Bca4012_073464 [Brassica carinata]|uniref:(rape) hypothetical protein n=2 Tax=Brassica napus TaxID=3708 RepID=A0A078GW99_BRANA|nr:unnamed protein product [Brassica napus]CDY29444.1 BnaC05g32260D [Brassica napus]